MLGVDKPKFFTVLTAGVLLLVLFATAFLVSREFFQTGKEDVVIVANGNILTMNANQPTASAMTVKEGKIIEVGDLAAVKKAAGKSYEYVDLEGKTVVPGFIESHDHLVQYGAVLEFDVHSEVVKEVQTSVVQVAAKGRYSDGPRPGKPVDQVDIVARQLEHR